MEEEEEGGGVGIPPQNDDVIYEQPLICIISKPNLALTEASKQLSQNNLHILRQFHRQIYTWRNEENPNKKESHPDLGHGSHASVPLCIVS